MTNENRPKSNVGSCAGFQTPVFEPVAGLVIAGVRKPVQCTMCLGAFQTPVFEPVAGLVIAGVRKPAQFQTFTYRQRKRLGERLTLLIVERCRREMPF
jgi:hypothetical protein